MKNSWILVAALGLLVQSPAFAINAKYAKQLERSGCTQATELQGCDINKTKAENAKAGFGKEAATEAASQGSKAGQMPHAGNPKAIGAAGKSIDK